jgi:predicted 3-demethylubiquinone-9 3-methyltransferase (glyoxalase superfamily)
MPNITPFLWFNTEAEEAMNFYVATFPNSRVKGLTRWGDGGPGPKGAVLTANFELDGKEFTALNGGPQFKFTEAVSFVVMCETQEEIDKYWDRLTGEGGQESMCGWLKDKYGLSWQIVPSKLSKLLGDPDSARAGRATQALLQMKKLDIAALEKAANG